MYDIEPEESIGTFQEAWKAAKKRTADEENRIPAVACRWHDLRHTFCTRLLERGTGFPIIAAVMGWSAATTVRMAKRYGHISGEVLRDAVLGLDGAGGPLVRFSTEPEESESETGSSPS